MNIMEDEGKYIYKDNKKPFDDDVNNPTHYKLPGLDVEAIDIIKSLSTPEEFRGFLKGNILKYILRAGKKGNEIKDYQKAQKYLEWLLNE